MDLHSSLGLSGVAWRLGRAAGDGTREMPLHETAEALEGRLCIPDQRRLPAEPAVGCWAGAEAPGAGPRDSCRPPVHMATSLGPGPPGICRFLALILDKPLLTLGLSFSTVPGCRVGDAGCECRRGALVFLERACGPFSWGRGAAGTPSPIS